jgi:hypothetical protein
LTHIQQGFSQIATIPPDSMSDNDILLAAIGQERKIVEEAGREN